ncbi:MAG: metallophosphoesterase [Polyangiaceae bacterium]|nr:metallophosphoesterase [Polyangiaceae bacterium]
MLVSVRLQTLGGARRRPAWLTRCIDEPVFVQWAAAALGLFAMIPGAALWALLRGAGYPIALTDVALAAFAAGLALALWGTFVTRRRVTVRHLSVELEGLPDAFDGYRIVQLTDLHIGNFDRVAQGLSWSRLANTLDADLTVVTGDLVTTGTSFYADVAQVLGELAARDGVFVILGNHDQWDGDAFRRVLTEHRLRVLANEWVELRRGDARLLLAGLDDPYVGRADLDRTLAGRPDAVPTILLSHYPDYFERATEHGVALVLAGHTHGGQIGLPLFADRINIATLTGQRGRGLFRQGSASLYVSSGLGTTGPPLRVGVAPEIACITLRPLAKSA